MKFFASLVLLAAGATAAAVKNTTNTLVANFVDFQTKPEWADPMEQFFKGFIPGVHKEKGTLQYYVTRSDVDRTRFKIFELYANMAAHDSHMSGSYQKVVQYIQQNDPLATAPTTEKQFPIMKW